MKTTGDETGKGEKQKDSVFKKVKHVFCRERNSSFLSSRLVIDSKPAKDDHVVTTIL